MWWASLTCTWLGAEGRLSFLFYWQAKRAALEMVVVGLKPSNGSYVSKYPLSRPGNLKDAFLATKIVSWVPAEDIQLWLSQAMALSGESECKCLHDTCMMWLEYFLLPFGIISVRTEALSSPWSIVWVCFYGQVKVWNMDGLLSGGWWKALVKHRAAWGHCVCACACWECRKGTESEKWKGPVCETDIFNFSPGSTTYFLNVPS